MNLHDLIAIAKDKSKFVTLEDYYDFCNAYLEFIVDGIQAEIVAKAETNYRFFQYREDGGYSVTRPLNKNLLLSIDNFDDSKESFQYSLQYIRDIVDDKDARNNINKFIYTCQQAIGATLDGLPAGESNFARKINGDLFERYIRLIIDSIGIHVEEGTECVPVIDNGEQLFSMAYQHDIIIKDNDVIKAIGSVKTSSKDRIDKIFIDKFLYNRLKGVEIPHFAIFLNDVQRKGKMPQYGVNTTFLTGHYKGYTVKLNPLDGVYYCDLRPVMIEDAFLRRGIRSLDCLLVEDIWNL